MAYNDGSDPTLAALISRYFVPSVYSKDVLMHTMSNLVCASAFTHRYENDLTIGSTCYIPVMTEGTATEVTPGTEAVSQDASTTGASITIDQWWYHAAEISPLAKIEEKADYMANAAKSSAYVILKKIDTTVGALFSSLTTASGAYGSDGQTFTDEIFRGLVQNLDEADVPDERFLIGDPSTKYDMLGIDKFVRGDYINGTPTSNGKFGVLYNANVFITNNLTATTTGNYGVYSHPDAIAVAIQKNMSAKYHDLGWKFIHKVITDAAWGVSEIRDTFGQAFYTRAK